jgi:hypothetical protein
VGQGVHDDFEMAAGKDVSAEHYGEEQDNADDLKHAEPTLAGEQAVK